MNELKEFKIDKIYKITELTNSKNNKNTEEIDSIVLAVYNGVEIDGIIELKIIDVMYGQRMASIHKTTNYSFLDEDYFIYNIFGEREDFPEYFL